jgi:hypothetical protein
MAATRARHHHYGEARDAEPAVDVLTLRAGNRKQPIRISHGSSAVQSRRRCAQHDEVDHVNARLICAMRFS